LLATYPPNPLPLNKGKGIKGIGLQKIKGEGLVNNTERAYPAEPPPAQPVEV